MSFIPSLKLMLEGVGFWVLTHTVLWYKFLGMKLHDIITSAREKKGWSQRKLAARAMVHYRTIQNIEAGGANPTMNTLMSIAMALEVPFADLMSVEKKND